MHINIYYPLYPANRAAGFPQAGEPAVPTGQIQSRGPAVSSAHCGDHLPYYSAEDIDRMDDITRALQAQRPEVNEAPRCDPFAHLSARIQAIVLAAQRQRHAQALAEKKLKRSGGSRLM
jgi:hypothetical protein